MKKLIFFLSICPFLLFGNDIKIPSKIKEVTVYLNSAQITRTANCSIHAGITKIDFNGLSSRIDESSIQIFAPYFISHNYQNLLFTMYITVFDTNRIRFVL